MDLGCAARIEQFRVRNPDRSEGLSAREPGSIKGDVKRKHFSLRRRRGSSLTSSPLRHAWWRRSAVLWSFSRPRYNVVRCGSYTSLAVAICQPWFYLRLAPKRGTMALLGCPREHMVPRETWRQRRTQPNPARILTLEPERSEPVDYRGHDSGMVFRTCALKRLVTSDIRRRTPLLSSRH